MISDDNNTSTVDKFRRILSNDDSRFVIKESKDLIVHLVRKMKLMKQLFHRTMMMVELIDFSMKKIYRSIVFRYRSNNSIRSSQRKFPITSNRIQFIYSFNRAKDIQWISISLHRSYL